jgi:beta-glucosidase
MVFAHFNNSWQSAIAAVVTFVLLFDCTYAATAPMLSQGAIPLYRQKDAAVEDRVEDLLQRMTLAEKVGQMALVEKNSLEEKRGDVTAFGIGGILSGAGAKPGTNTPDGWKAMIDSFQAAAARTRLGIPLLYGVDAIHGHGHVPGATVFPHAIGLGAAADPLLTYQVAAATAAEVRATGVNWSYSPNLDIPRDIRWGRVYEGFSDRSSVVAALGAAYTLGTVGPAGSGLVATAKHYVGLGSMEWDSSTNPSFRIDQGRTNGSYDDLYTVYLPPFQAAIAAGVQSVMVGLNSWDREKMSAHKYLVTNVLKDKLAFEGFVVSDWYGVYELPGSKFTAAVTAINAGVDMVMLPYEYEPFITDVIRAHERGLVTTERIDDAVRRILRVKFRAGLFDATTEYRTAEEQFVQFRDEHRDLARRAVAASAVLLKNTNDSLPIRLEKTSSTTPGTDIIIAGSAADNVGMQSGAWTLEWQGVSGNVIAGGTSIAAGILSRVGDSATVTVISAADDIPTVKKANIGIAVVGETPYAEGWGDREYPVLSYEDRVVIERLRAAVKTLIVVVVSGRPLFIEKELPQIDALVAAWLPGMAGEGIADVLFGAVPFTGTLPVTWPLRSEQLPFSARGESRDGTEPLYPSGFGITQ